MTGSPKMLPERLPARRIPRAHAFRAALRILGRPLAISLASAVLAGCGGGGGDGGTGPGPGPPDPATLLAQGWERFQARGYEEAVQKFRAAISGDPTMADAYHGLGWALSYIDSLESAVANLAQSIDLGRDSSDAHAGLASAHLAAEDFALSVQEADTVLARDPFFAFSRDTGIDYHDIFLIKAACHLRVEDEWALAEEALKTLDPELVFDPESPDYFADLVEAYEALRSQHGSGLLPKASH